MLMIIGVFKEFLNRILKEALNPNCGLFQVSSDGLIYPSTNALTHEGNEIDISLKYFQLEALIETSIGHYCFLGKIIGKALRERVLVDVNFAPFFLSKLIGQSSQGMKVYYVI